MYTFLIVITIIISFLLMVVVLLQAGKGEGLAGITGGPSGSFGSVFGARRTADFLSKATWWLGGSLFVLAIVINLFFLPGQTTQAQRESIIQNSKMMVPTTPTVPTLPPANESQGQKNNNSQNPGTSDNK
jgi:preprotein translocase subunit SecG